MTIDGNIIDETPQYDINRKAAKKSALSSSKTDKFHLHAKKYYPLRKEER